MFLQPNVTASPLHPYKLMLQHIYYVLIIYCYNLYITFLQSNVTAYIFHSYILMQQPIYIKQSTAKAIYYVLTI